MKLVMLPPQTDITLGWARRLAATLPAVEVVVAEGVQQAQHGFQHPQQGATGGALLGQ